MKDAIGEMRALKQEMDNKVQIFEQSKIQLEVKILKYSKFPTRIELYAFLRLWLSEFAYIFFILFFIIQENQYLYL